MRPLSPGSRRGRLPTVTASPSAPSSTREEKAGWDFGAFPPEQLFSQGKAVFFGKLSFSVIRASPPAFLEVERYFSTTSASHVNISPTLLLCGISQRCDTASATTRKKRLDPPAQVMKIPLTAAVCLPGNSLEPSLSWRPL